MALVKVKPTSPGRRGVVKVVTPGLHKGKPHAPLLESQSKMLVATIMAALQPVIKVVVISSIIVLSTFVAIKTVFLRKWKGLSMIQTGQRILHCFVMRMASVATLLRRVA